MRLKITTKEGKSEVVDVAPATECAFEIEFKGGFYKLLRDNERQSDLYWIAHHAMKRKGLTQLALDAFIDSLVEVDIVTDSPNG